MTPSRYLQVTLGSTLHHTARVLAELKPTRCKLNCPELIPTL
jgi:hypothetical protein